MSISKQEMQEFDEWYTDKQKDPEFVAMLEDGMNYIIIKTMWENDDLQNELALYKDVAAAARKYLKYRAAGQGVLVIGNRKQRPEIAKEVLKEALSKLEESE